VSTQNILHSSAARYLGTWGSFYGGDSQFLLETCKKIRDAGGPVTWCDSVTCVYGPPLNMTYAEVKTWYAADLQQRQEK
jgi:hypothetical protein